MARIRTIKPDFFRHVALYEAEIKYKLPLRISFAGLWTACDREGRFKWNPRTLKLDVLPYDEVDFSRVLDALLACGFIVKYLKNDQEFGCIPTWHLHQVINNREKESILPPLEESTVLTREERVDNALVTPLVHTPVEGKGREGKGRGKGNREGAMMARPDFIDQQLWNDWLIIRNKKNAPLTQTAWELFCNEAAKAGYPIEDAIKECCLRNWASFKSKWVAERQTESERAREHMAELTRGMATPKPKNFWEKTIDETNEVIHVETKRLL
jgi:hypothetical protein